MTDLPDLELSLPASAENVGVVRHVLGGVGEALHLDAETLDDLRLAVSEACANAVIHAYVHGDGLMDIAVAAHADELHVSVRDHGTGMAPRTDSPGLGVGLPLIASLSTSMEVLTPPGGGTEIKMRFPLPVEPRRPPGRFTGEHSFGGTSPQREASYGHERRR